MARKLQKKEIVEKFEKMLIFLVLFNLLAVPLYIILYTNVSFEPLQKLNAQLLYNTLHFFGYNTKVDGSIVYLTTDSNQHKIEISWDSTGWKSMYAVAALIIATPLGVLSKKFKFIVLGIVTIFVLNYLRITTTILISANFGFHLFDIIHTVLWREGLILAVVSFWSFWLWREKYNISRK